MLGPGRGWLVSKFNRRLECSSSYSSSSSTTKAARRRPVCVTTKSRQPLPGVSQEPCEDVLDWYRLRPS